MTTYDGERPVLSDDAAMELGACGYHVGFLQFMIDKYGDELRSGAYAELPLVGVLLNAASDVAPAFNALRSSLVSWPLPDQNFQVDIEA